MRGTASKNASWRSNFLNAFLRSAGCWPNALLTRSVHTLNNYTQLSRAEMSKNSSSQFIKPPNVLKAKMDGNLKNPDEDLIARAEKAMEELSSEFSQWINEDVEKLSVAFNNYYADPSNLEARKSFECAAHDLKGLGSTYEFPLVTRFAGDLHTIIENADAGSAPDKKVAKAYVDSIRAIVSQNIKDPDNPVAQALLAELQGLGN